MKKVLSAILLIAFVSFSFATPSVELVKPKIENVNTFQKVENVVFVATNDVAEFAFQEVKSLNPNVNFEFVAFYPSKKLVFLDRTIHENVNIFGNYKKFNEADMYKNKLIYRFTKNSKLSRASYSNWRC